MNKKIDIEKQIDKNTFTSRVIIQAGW